MFALELKAHCLCAGTIGRPPPPHYARAHRALGAVEALGQAFNMNANTDYD